MRTALSWMQTVLFDIVAPILLYQIMVGSGSSETTALLISGIAPAISLLITVLVERKVDEVAMIVLIFLGLGVIGALLFSDPRLILLKEAAVTGLFGVAFLASLFAPRPLTFFFGRKFATGGVPARVEWWNGLWRFEGFRHTQRYLTTVWGVVLIVEAVVRGLLTYTLSTGVMVAVNAIAPAVVIAALIAYTIWYGRRAAAKAPPGSGAEFDTTAEPATG